MAKYRVLAKSFVNNALAEEGQVVEYEGEPGANLELIVEQEKGKKGKNDNPPAASKATEDLV